MKNELTPAAQRALVSGNYGRSQRLLFRLGLIDQRWPSILPKTRLTEAGEGVRALLIAEGVGAEPASAAPETLR